MPLWWPRRKSRSKQKAVASGDPTPAASSPRNSVDLGPSPSPGASPWSPRRGAWAWACAQRGLDFPAAGRAGPGPSPASRCCTGVGLGGAAAGQRQGLPLPRPASKSAPLPLASSREEVDAAAAAAAGCGACVSAAASVSSECSSESDEAPDRPIYRYTDPVVYPGGRTMPLDGHKGIGKAKHLVSCSALREHKKFFEVPIANVREVHFQSFEPSTSETSCLRGRMLPEGTFGTRARSPSPGPRGRAFADTHASSGDFGFSPRSPVKRMDDLKSPSQPLPLPPFPVDSSTLPISPIDSTQSQSEWRKGKLLGSGMFGQVYLGFNSESGQFCAIKEVQVILGDSNSKERLRQLGQEIDVLRQLSHQNIVQYYGSEQIDASLSIYLEFVSGGSIHKLLGEYGPFKEPVVRKYTRQILSGLAYLHSRDTMHRDIKGANILVGPNGDVKLADFGMAKHIKSFAEIQSFRGSPYWMAPEVIMNNKGYSFAVDIWSLGCTIIEMATARHPWHQYEDVAAIFKIANSKETPEIPDFFSNEGKDFLSLCLKRDPAQRPSATQLLGHPFFHDNQTIRATKCTSTQLRNGLSSHAESSHKKSNREISSRINITPLRDIGVLSARDFTGFSTAYPSPLNTSSSHIVARTNMSLPVSPCSSPLRQFKQSNWSCLPSPQHPSASSGSAAYNPKDHMHNQMLRSTAIPDPWHDIGQLRPPSPYGSPKRF